MLFRSALAEKVAFVPGNNTLASHRHLRLNFSYGAPEQIREGIRRLSAAVKSQFAQVDVQLV